MQEILDFIATNYLWFLGVTVVLILALIGYFVDIKKDQDDSPFKQKKKPKEVAKPAESMENITMATNMSLNEMINNSANNSNPTSTTAKKE